MESAEEQTVEVEGLSWMEGEDRTEEQPMAEPEPSEQPTLPPAVQPQPSQNPAPPRETYKGVVLKVNPPTLLLAAAAVTACRTGGCWPSSTCGCVGGQASPSQYSRQL